MKKLLGLLLIFCFSTMSFADAFPQISTRVNYGSTPVNTTTWVQLVASAPYAINGMNIFDSSGSTMQIGVGAA